MAGDRRPDPFAELADESRAEDAVRRRVQERWLRHQAAEEATLVGALVDLAESRRDVSLRSRSGRTYRGVVSTVGGDFVVVGDDAWVRLAAVVAVRFDAAVSSSWPLSVDAVAGERGAPRDTLLTGALSSLVGDRPAVVVVPLDGEPALRGELVGVGVDVLTLVLDGDVASRCVVAVDAVAEVVVLG